MHGVNKATEINKMRIHISKYIYLHEGLLVKVWGMCLVTFKKTVFYTSKMYMSRVTI